MKQFFLATCLLTLILGCATGPTDVDCRTQVDLGVLGLLTQKDRVWTVDSENKFFDDLKTYAARCFSNGRPLAFVTDEARKFLGTARLASRGRAEPESWWRFFDDFNTRTDRRRPAATCRPSDYTSLKESHGIIDVRERRILVSSEDLTDQDIEFASAWLERCLPTRDPLAWVTAEDELIGVYHHRRFDRFK